MFPLFFLLRKTKNLGYYIENKYKKTEKWREEVDWLSTSNLRNKMVGRFPDFFLSHISQSCENPSGTELSPNM